MWCRCHELATVEQPRNWRCDEVGNDVTKALAGQKAAFAFLRIMMGDSTEACRMGPTSCAGPWQPKIPTLSFPRVVYVGTSGLGEWRVFSTVPWEMGCKRNGTRDRGARMLPRTGPERWGGSTLSRFWDRDSGTRDTPRHRHPKLNPRKDCSQPRDLTCLPRFNETQLLLHAFHQTPHNETASPKRTAVCQTQDRLFTGGKQKKTLILQSTRFRLFFPFPRR